MDATNPTLAATLGPCQCIYLAEGAANIVFSFYPVSPTRSLYPSAFEEYSDTTPPPSDISDDKEDNSTYAIVDHNLLRLRKDLPTTIKVADSQELWERLVKPLFEDNEIVHQQLVKIPIDHLETLNYGIIRMDMEKAVEDRRPAKRTGIYLAQDEHGLLVTDMRASAGYSTVFEFKPKWLTQSPSAPANALRCRQCALTARRNQTSFCPLDLVSTNIYDSLYVVTKLLPPTAGQSETQRLTKWIVTTKLLRKLCNIQQALDNQGPLSADPADEKFRVAMTLRDCTMFLKFPDNEEEDVVAKIGDLDVKSPAKGAQWKETEEELVREGWYAGTEGGGKEEITCRLGRMFNTKDRV